MLTRFFKRKTEEGSRPWISLAVTMFMATIIGTVVGTAGRDFIHQPFDYSPSIYGLVMCVFLGGYGIYRYIRDALTVIAKRIDEVAAKQGIEDTISKLEPFTKHKMKYRNQLIFGSIIGMAFILWPESSSPNTRIVVTPDNGCEYAVTYVGGHIDKFLRNVDKDGQHICHGPIERKGQGE